MSASPSPPPARPDAPDDALARARDDGARWHGRFVVLATYVVAAVVALITVRVVGPADAWTASWWVHAAATAVVYASSMRHDNTSVYDPYWSVVPGAIMLTWVIGLDLAGDPVRQAFLGIVVAAWSIRLTANWARGWSGLQHEDWRYEQYRDGGTLRYAAISLVGLHGVPTFLVALGAWPAWRAVATPAGLSLLDGLALALGLGSVALEHVADEQARAFRAQRTDPGDVLRTGVWAWSRHPNYLGEIGFWTSLAVFALAAGWSHILTFVAPTAMFLLFRFISIPMMERRQLARKPAYASLIADVPMLWPRPPRATSGPPAIDEDTFIGPRPTPSVTDPTLVADDSDTAIDDAPATSPGRSGP